MSRCRRSSAFTKPVSVGTGALVNPTDSATIKPAFLSVGELQAGLVPVPGISARRNKLRRSLSSHSCSCRWKSKIRGRRGRCGAIRLSQMSFKFGDSLGERRRLVFCLELRELFLELGHLSLKHVELLVLLFGLRYFSDPTLSSGALDSGYCSQTRRRTSCRLAVRAEVSYSIRNVGCSFGIKGLSARHSQLRSHFPQYSSRLSRSFGVVHELLLAYCSCSLNCLGSFVSTESTEPSFGELRLPCRNRRRHARSFASSDYGNALWETLMLVCLPSAIRVSALA